jgi:hypothetical protein
VPFSSTPSRRTALALLASLSVSPSLAAGASLNDVARYLAGLPVAAGSPLEALTQEPIWRTHAQQLNAAWARLDAEQLAKIRAWSATHVTSPNRTLLYMFSGPDYLYARAFYPHARTYVLAGLELPGAAPDLLGMNVGLRQRGLENLRLSMKTILHASFFVTADMQKELHGQGFLGVVPVLFVFLARSGMEIRGLNYLRVNNDGLAEEVATAPAQRPSGLKITFYDREASTERVLYYFSVDLANAGLHPGFVKFLESQGASDAFFKSASYLVHGANFSRIRNVLLERSRRIIQDDTGVRLDDYNRNEWNIRPFGRYSKPIPVFEGMYQPSMARFFAEQKAEPLNFRLGYGTESSSILLATRK